jgi:hypothetical protein
VIIITIFIWNHCSCERHVCVWRIGGLVPCVLNLRTR